MGQEGEAGDEPGCRSCNSRHGTDPREDRGGGALHSAWKDPPDWKGNPLGERPRGVGPRDGHPGQLHGNGAEGFGGVEEESKSPVQPGGGI